MKPQLRFRGAVIRVRGCTMTSIAVVAHSEKTLGGGLGELRETLAREGFPNPQWYEVAKSRQAPKSAQRAVKDGADLLFVWGGDGTVQRCIDAVAGKSATDRIGGRSSAAR